MTAVQWLILSHVSMVLFMIAALRGLAAHRLPPPSPKAANVEQLLANLNTRLYSGFYTQTNQGSPGSSLDGDAHQGAPSQTDPDPNIGSAGATYVQSYEQAQSNRINNLENYYNTTIGGDLTSAVNRINNLIDAHNNLVNGPVTSVINRVNQIQDMLRSAGMMG
jgi:hypothetical protein